MNSIVFKTCVYFNFAFRQYLLLVEIWYVRVTCYFVQCYCYDHILATKL